MLGAGYWRFRAVVLPFATIRTCAPDRNTRPDLHRGPGYVHPRGPSHRYPAVGIDVGPQTDLHPDLEASVRCLTNPRFSDTLLRT